MLRRDLLLLGTSAAAASVTSALVACADQKKPASPAAVVPAGSADRHPDLVAAAGKCVAAGEICLSHCVDSLAAGETMLGQCARVVHQMLAVCKMLATLASAGSSHLAQAAALCDAVCKDCKAACDQHASMHPECKGCADACGEMLAQLAKGV